MSSSQDLEAILAVIGSGITMIVMWVLYAKQPSNDVLNKRVRNEFCEKECTDEVFEKLKTEKKGEYEELVKKHFSDKNIYKIVGIITTFLFVFGLLVFVLIGLMSNSGESSGGRASLRRKCRCKC